MEEAPKHEERFVLMDANARTGMREKVGVKGKDNNIIFAYVRDTLNYNGELLTAVLC